MFAFFITCAFAYPPSDPLKATTLQYVTRISMWVVQLTLIVDAVFLMFFMFCVLRREIEWMKMGTNIWTARQLIILQVNIPSYNELDPLNLVNSHFLESIMGVSGCKDSQLNQR